MSYDAQLIEQGLCPELVWITTEDGPVTGRCQAPIVEATVPAHSHWGQWVEAETIAIACEGHSAERIGWITATEAETIAWERQHD